MSPILLATNSKTGIFGSFPKEEPKFVTFKTGILRGHAIKVTTKVKLHEGNQLGLELYQFVNFKTGIPDGPGLNVKCCMVSCSLKGFHKPDVT